MHIDIRGSSQHVPHNEWVRAVGFLGNELLGKRMSSRCHLNLELVGYMRGDLGFLTCSDWKTRRKFMIQINTGGGKRVRQLRTLAHEMVHMKQVVRGELHRGQVGVLWRGTNGSGRFPDQPWEDEAYGREKELADLFMRTPVPARQVSEYERKIECLLASLPT